MLGRQPSFDIREVSSSFRGVPSGLLASNSTRPCSPLHGYCFGQFADAAVLSNPHVDMREPGFRVSLILLSRQLQNVKARRCKIVYVHELAQRGACTPHGYLRRTRDLRFMESTHQGGHHVRTFEIEVIARPIEIGRHHASIIAAVLAVKAFAKLDPRYLGDGIRLVGRLEVAAQQRFLRNRLRRIAWVDAGGSQEEQSLNAGLVCAVDQVAFDGKVFVNEIRRKLVVCADSANPSRQPRSPNRSGLTPRTRRPLAAESDRALVENVRRLQTCFVAPVCARLPNRPCRGGPRRIRECAASYSPPFAAP
jgi:hypothetical protein